MARIAALACIAFLMAAPTAAARSGAVAPIAPEYTSSEPEDGAKLHQAPDTVSATFSEPLDPSSEMTVKDHCGNQIDDGNVEVSLNEMSVGIASTPSGHYMVSYSAEGLGGATGSTEGRFSFVVHAGKPCGDGSGGGGHDGHGGPGGQTGGGHGKHGGGAGASGSGHGGEHSGAGGSETHMGGTNHETTDDGTGTHAEHDPAADGEAGKGHASHARKDPPEPRDESGLSGIAAGETPLPDLSPDSAAVLLALVICAAFGGLGGWFLRVSAQK